MVTMTLINEQQQAKVQHAIGQAEKNTDAELVTVLAGESDDYYFIPTMWAALVSLVTPAVLLQTNLWLSQTDMLWIQLLEFIALALVFRWQPLKHLLVPKRVKHARASLLAKQQFLSQGLHHTRGETGLLIFVSEAERYAEILADRGINNLVPEGAWDRILQQLLGQIKANNTEAGLIDAIEACGNLLAEHVPSTHDQDELPNHLVIL
jgi:putative membrane protein|tara:strand:+ start:20993 stop:21616 length:624 start_codon:yes stop_codon:yes gene_type:complete